MDDNMNRVNKDGIKRLETDLWLETYASETERARRREAMPEKLRRLGLFDADRNARILDMCCGHGEGLDAMYELGFRDLSGIDITVPKSLSTDRRFTVRQGSATSTGFEVDSFDWITCIHSMHHFADAQTVKRFRDESWRLLRPGGRLAIIDFPGSLAIRLAFWYFRQPSLHMTKYQKYFGRIIQEEWSFLQHYLPQWSAVRTHLWEGPFKVERQKNGLFYFYLTLRKPQVASV